MEEHVTPAWYTTYTSTLVALLSLDGNSATFCLYYSIKTRMPIRAQTLRRMCKSVVSLEAVYNNMKGTEAKWPTAKSTLLTAIAASTSRSEAI